MDSQSRFKITAWLQGWLTQSFILPRSIKWVPGIVKSCLLVLALWPLGSWTLCIRRSHKVFFINELFIQCNTDSCCEHITGDVNIYLHYLCRSFDPSLCCVCVCVCCVCVCVCVGGGGLFSCKYCETF